MRILIDECLDWRLCRALSEHYCVSVPEKGWAGLSNGALLRKAQDEFDVFLTADTNLSFQQNLTRYDIAIVVLEARSTRIEDTTKLMPQVRKILTTIEMGKVVRVRPDSGDDRT
jgi:uncharacterized protein DUF5615